MKKITLATLVLVCTLCQSAFAAIYSISSTGVKTSIPTLDAAITGASYEGGELHITSAYSGTSITFPSGQKVVLERGGKLNYSGAITFLGGFEADDSEHFTGAATVIGIPKRVPEWWGAVGGDGLDDNTSFSRMLAGVTYGNVVVNKDFNFSGSLSIGAPITLEGNGRLIFSGSDGVVVTHDGNPLTQNIIKGVSILTTSSGLYTGIKVTSVASSGYKVPRVVIEDVNVSGDVTTGITTHEWKTLVELIEADGAYLNNVGMKGKETAYTSGFDSESIGLKMTDCTTVHARALQIYRVKTAISNNGQTEGFALTDSELVVVDKGFVQVDTINPSNNLKFSNVHIAANTAAVTIGKNTNGLNTLAHHFSNMFLLKRVEATQPVGGNDNYRGFIASIDQSTFNGITTLSNSNLKDYYTTGDVSFDFQGESLNNVGSGIVMTNAGTGFNFASGSVENNFQSVTMVNNTAFAMTPKVSVNNARNIFSVLYNTGTPANNTYSLTATSFDFYTSGGRAFEVTNGATVTDSWVMAFGGALADTRATLSSKSATGAKADLRLITVADGDIHLQPNGSGLLKYGVELPTGITFVTGCVKIKLQDNTETCLATVAIP